MRGKLRRSKGSGLLIDDPLGEGSKASSTNAESDLSQSSGGENSFVRMRGKLRHSEGSGLLIDDPLGEGSKASSTKMSSGGRRTHSSE